MIYVDQPTLFIPAEGQRSMLLLAQSALCNGCPAGTGVGTPPAAIPPYRVWAVLTTIDAPIVASLTMADLGGIWTFDSGGAVQLNGEEAPTYCLGMIEGPDIGVDGLWRIVMDQVIWTFNTLTVSVYGLALVIVALGDDPTTEGLLLAYGRLTTPPASLAAEGDAIKLTAELVPCLCLPPAIPDVPE